MTAERLYSKDGSPTKAWSCTICACVVRSEKDATRCCHCEDCGALSDKPGQWSRCAACDAAWWDAERDDVATKRATEVERLVAKAGPLLPGEQVFHGGRRAVKPREWSVGDVCWVYVDGKARKSVVVEGRENSALRVDPSGNPLDRRWLQSSLLFDTAHACRADEALSLVRLCEEDVRSFDALANKAERVARASRRELARAKSRLAKLRGGK